MYNRKHFSFSRGLPNKQTQLVYITWKTKVYRGNPLSTFQANVSIRGKNRAKRSWDLPAAYNISIIYVFCGTVRPGRIIPQSHIFISPNIGLVAFDMYRFPGS